MANIRPYRESDKYNVQRICLQTIKDDIVFEGLNRINADYFLPVYNNYYTECEPENCFVCTDENDNAVGYIICAEDVKKWRKVFMEKYYPQIKHRKPIERIEAIGEVIAHSMFMKKYPAHLHIDIYKEHRGNGTGTQLMNTLVEHLRAKGIKGVQLCVDAQNEKAIKFYKRNGFKILMNFVRGYAMGLEIK